jgi:peptidoglycan/LPS O-acetylase OafA/YrhL
VIAGLDGIRAVAVLAVMAYHAGATWAAGGQLGVDIFFVLSGYLVTSLLIAEHQRRSTIGLRRFWARRARRLLPALFILLLGICAYVRWAGAGLSPTQMRGNALATLLYVANWHYVFTGQDYFTAYGAPSPLLHTWSLAVEEQFYLIWPIFVVVALHRWGRTGLAWVAASVAALSAMLCAGLYMAGVSTTTLYYGTDTRAQTLMVGSLLAIYLHRPGAGDPGRPLVSRVARSHLVGLLGVLGALGLMYCLHHVDGRRAFLYEGGFLVVAFLTATVIALTVLAPTHWLSRALSPRPLRYIGRISYGLYLYHWPIFLALTANRVGLRGWQLLTVRFGVTFAVAALSYQLVEEPIRSQRLTMATLFRAPRAARGVALAVMPALVVASLLAVTVPPATGAPAGPPPPTAGYVAPGGADAARPERVMLLGDSLSLTLGEGLMKDSGAWGVTLLNDGAVGCDLDPQSTVDVKGSVGPTAQGCPKWRSSYAELVARQNPDVVVVLLGRWESLDRLYGGQWTTVGGDAFDAHLRDELSQLIEMTSAHGAQVAFLTLPYIAETTVQPDGSPWDINRPARTDAYNADVRAAVARHPGTASVIDLNRIVDPSGHYQTFIGPVRIRDFDDEHFALSGGMYLRSILLPDFARLGSAHYEARSG